MPKKQSNLLYEPILHEATDKLSCITYSRILLISWRFTLKAMSEGLGHILIIQPTET